MESALLFAHTWRASSGVKASQIREFVGKEGGMILSASEKCAQARRILDVIESHTNLDQRALLDAQFGGENGERHAGVERLTHLCAHQNRTLVRLLMMREFVHGERYCPSQQDIARECAVHQTTVSRVAPKIAKTIAELRESTIAKLTPAFQRRGWVPHDET
jgi:hypothetical protein